MSSFFRGSQASETVVIAPVSAPDETRSLTSGDNEVVVRRFIDEVINHGDDSAMQELVHPDYEYRSPDHSFSGRDGLKALFEGYRAGIPDLSVSIDELVGSGDRVVIAITMNGTHTGNLMGIPATGRSLKVHGMVLSRLEGGKIVEEWEILDRLEMFEQLGVVSLPA